MRIYRILPLLLAVSLLTACGLKDIGCYFPDTDKRYKGADSADLLAEVLKMVNERGFAPANISVTVQAEKPKLAPHIDEMNASLAKMCSLPAECVAIAAGTSERLGFVGEGLGIVAYATVLMKTV